MTDYAKSRNFNREDGKVEHITLYDNGQQLDILGDAVCTWHEDRLVTPQGIGISKQRIRDKVKALNPEWYADIERAKKEAKVTGAQDFRALLNPAINYVSPSVEFFNGLNTLFRAATNQWVDSKVYDVYPSEGNSLAGDLEKAVAEFQRVN